MASAQSLMNLKHSSLPGVSWHKFQICFSKGISSQGRTLGVLGQFTYTYTVCKHNTVNWFFFATIWLQGSPRIFIQTFFIYLRRFSCLKMAKDGRKVGLPRLVTKKRGLVCGTEFLWATNELLSCNVLDRQRIFLQRLALSRDAWSWSSRRTRPWTLCSTSGCACRRRASACGGSAGHHPRRGSNYSRKVMVNSPRTRFIWNQENSF